MNLLQRMISGKGPSRGAGAIVVIAAALAAYLNTLWGGFVYDDVKVIIENTWIRDFRHLPAMFTSNAWGFHEDIKTSNYYRPMMHVFHMAAYYAFGLKPWGHHLLNVVLNAAASLAVFLVFAGLLRGRGDEEPQFSVNAFALAGALLFALHPVHTEVVAWASAMAELEASSFGLFGLYLYMRLDAGRWRIFSALLLFLAILTKETAIAYFLLIAAYDLCMKGRFEIRRYWPYAVMLGVYFAMRFNALGGFSAISRHTELTGYEAFINVFPLFGKYFWKLVLPANLNAFYVFHPIRSILEWKGAAGVAFAAAYAAAILLSKGAWRFALLWMALPLLPVLYAPLLGPAKFAERYLYLPAAGFAILISFAAATALSRRTFGEKAPAVLAAALAFVICLYAYGTISRNAVWRNSFTLWSDTVRKSPDGAIPHYEMGLAYTGRGEREKAVEEYRAALKINPSYVSAHNNLGVAYYEMGRIDEAIAEFEAAVRFDASRAGVHSNLGFAYASAGRMNEAEAELKEAERLKSVGRIK